MSLVYKDASLFFAALILMDGEKDCQRKKGAQGSSHQSQNNASNSLPVSGEEADWEGALTTEKHGDLGDMTFCMANYMKEAMKMMFMMRSHHMLTDVILEVGTELFHAHKVILAAASPYFKVSLVLPPCEKDYINVNLLCS